MTDKLVDDVYQEKVDVKDEIKPKKTAKPRKKILSFDPEELIPKTHIEKCKVRCAKRFNVPIKHIEKAYVDLTGKKVDGFYVTDIFDRYGFVDGFMSSRKQLSEKYKVGTNQKVVDVVEDKLETILKNENVKKSYGSYIADEKLLINKDVNDKAVYGE